MEIRDYDEDRDHAAVQRIWREVGWLGHDEKLPRPLVRESDSIVFTIDGEPECCVMSVPGTIRHGDEDVALGAVTAVTTSHIARRMGVARKLTSRMLARQAQDGLAVSALGIFDQGFYNTVGYGNGCYVNEITFDPATLETGRPFRRPKRLTKRDSGDMYQAMLNRKRTHGGCNLHSPQMIRAEFGWLDNFFALGYYDGPDGSLSHFVFGEMKDEHGPYRVVYMAYQTTNQLLELLSMLASLGDQVNAITMLEPPDIQLQDLLKQPFRTRRGTRGSKLASDHDAYACWQMRMLDVPKCLQATHLDTKPLSFNLYLTDPVAEFLTGDNDWTGVGGEYIVTLGEESSAELGMSSSLPMLSASVGAFTRLWLGVRPASSLAVTDDLEGDDELLKNLDRTLCLPLPNTGWDF